MTQPADGLEEAQGADTKPQGQPVVMIQTAAAEVQASLYVCGLGKEGGKEATG